MNLFMKITITGLVVIVVTILCFLQLDYERGQPDFKIANKINNHKQIQHISPSKGIQTEREEQKKRHDIVNSPHTKLLISSPKEMRTNSNEQSNLSHVSESTNPFKVSASPAFKIYVMIYLQHSTMI